MSIVLMTDIFKKYSTTIEASLHRILERFVAKDNSLREPLEYSLLSGGKRIRPLIIHIIANSIGKNYDVSEAAISVELVHTSALIADDLPCMDNDSERRNKPSLHVAFGEATALLSSYAFICLAYDCIRYNVKAFQAQEGIEKAYLIYDLVIENVTVNAGILGVLGGQHEDLFLKNPSSSQVLQMLHKKTGSLFELAFVSGWLFGGGSVALLPTLKQVAANFGLIFQIKDDLLDAEEDLKEQKVNYALLFGKDTAERLLEEKFQETLILIEKLQIDDFELLGILEFLRYRNI